VPDAADASALPARIDAALTAFLAKTRPRLESAGPELSVVGDVVSDLLLLGKHLRPAFCYWGWRGAGGGDCDEIVAAASSLDLLHACAIVHDDVMDASDTRRGLPSTHRRFSAQHTSAAWHGSPDAFGVGAAILLGDLCLAWSDEMLATCGLGPEAIRRARTAYDEMRTEVMAGQYLDLVEQARGGGSVERAMRVVRFKSAKYTVERPLHVGGLLADAPAALLDAYTAYGLPIGEAFQLRDDLLGVFGDPGVTGKPAGDDIREGKRTVLVALAMDRADPTERATLEKSIGNPGIDDADIAGVRDVLVSTGATDAVETLIDELTTNAVAALDAAPIDADARTALRGLAVAATQRST
jgi:geranylgeranyl diphosphate synthase, type I